MRMHASDRQAFLGMRVIQKELTKNEDCIHSITQDKNVEKVALSYSIDPYIQDFLTNVQKLGSTKVVSCPSEGIELVRIKDRQAQILVTQEKQVVNTINNINFNLKQELNTSCVKTRGCCVTAQTEYFLTDYNNNQEKLITLNSFGKTDFTLKMSAEYYSFYDLVCIDAKTVAISTGYSHDKTGVMIMDFITKKVKRKLETEIHESHLKLRMGSSARERLVNPIPDETAVVLRHSMQKIR
ncbi:Hypothetical predicted protein [Mytilus galloprovincialis]|uniref:Uncharacterized protein n=1 Tax=Mytilus galloprovincialis TaxID=29158 RepID=A0A8B6BK23_MYTGA|nr:Hypothetical predicted protein [Mytilus galloprovincialis]